MTEKISIGLQRSIDSTAGEAIQATVQMELEIDGEGDQIDNSQFREGVLRAYGRCRQALEVSLASQRGETANANLRSPELPEKQFIQPVTPMNHGNAGTSIPKRLATANQIRAIHAISKKSGVDLYELLFNQFGVTYPNLLSIGEESQLIDQLKSGATVASNRRTKYRMDTITTNEASPSESPDRFIRQRDLIARDKLTAVSVTVIGVGAIGRQVAVQLASLGVAKLQLVDFDRVESHNITTQGYHASDISQPKVIATS